MQIYDTGTDSWSQGAALPQQYGVVTVAPYNGKLYIFDVKGRMFILVDDEDRENEGDLVIPAQCATPEAINFMAKHARGLICLALTRERVAAIAIGCISVEFSRNRRIAYSNLQ